MAQASIFRFFNPQLRGVYETCPLPTEAPFNAAHTILASTYTLTTERRSAWGQTLRVPPSLPLGVNTQTLADPFLSDQTSTEKEKQNKRQKTSTEAEKKREEETSSSTNEKKEPKRKIGQRKVPFVGEPRVYKIQCCTEARDQAGLSCQALRVQLGEPPCAK